MQNLNEVKVGQKAVITDVKGDSRFLSRVTSIGLSLGCEIDMLYNEKKFPLLLYGRDTVIALNREESQNIFVEVIA
ncbi:MAG TPA: ferrous iron transport protein A [Mogibacterium sp.]|nr:ferrous iron transport protein A [Mogibacterium sp.]